MTGPDPTQPFPLGEADRRCMFLRPTVTSDKIEVGDYTYYDASQDQGSFEQDRMLYAYGPERLIIGKFCSLAARPDGRVCEPGASNWAWERSIRAPLHAQKVWAGANAPASSGS